MHAPFVQLGRLRQTLALDPSTVGESGCAPAGRSLGFACRQDSGGLSEKDLKSMLMGFAEKKEHCREWGVSQLEWGAAICRHWGKGA